MNPNQTKTQLPTDQFVIFAPHNEQLKNDLLSRKIDNVIVSMIDGDEITDLVYQDFIFCDGVIQARVENKPLYWLVSFMAGPEVETIGDIFKRYDGEIYHTVDKLSVLSKTRSQLAEICGKDGKNTESLGVITIVTAFDSKYNGGDFGYIRCLDHKYDNAKRDFQSVTFHISRYGEYQHRIDFAVPVTEHQAIEATEKFLSKSLDKKYYDVIADDLFCKRLPWAEAMKQYKCRGDCLTDRRFISNLTSVDGHIEFTCGS